ncbi:MAG: SLC13 family permease [Oligoflexia bacterium]|nr:SLC13 family permease [Oligoflexia bacterium]
MITVLLIIAVMVVLFLTEHIPLDLTALVGLLALLLSGYLTPEEALVGFSSPTTITLVSMFVLSAALRETGVADRAAHLVHRWVGQSEQRCVAAVILLGVVFSSFMANVAAVALLLPSVLALAQRARVAPSRLLIPLSFAVLLGGMTTIIGTSPNLLAAQLLRERGLESFHFFDFTPVGLGVALCGGIFLWLFGWRMLPVYQSHVHTGPRDNLPKLYRLYERVFSVRVPHASKLCGKSLSMLRFASALGSQVIAIVRGGRKRLAPRGTDVLEGGDLLVVAGQLSDLEELKQFSHTDLKRAVIAGAEQDLDEVRVLGEVEVVSENVASELESLEVGIVEVVLSPRSSLIGRTIREANFREQYGFQVLGIWRAGEPMRARLGNIQLQFGDALLLQGPRLRIPLLASDRDFVVLSESEPPAVRRYGAVLTVAAFVLMVALSVSGYMHIEIAALLATALVLLARVLPMQQVYREIEWRIVVFVSALLPLGVAVQRSGLADEGARLVLGLTGGASPWMALVLLALLASAISQLFDAAPAVVLLAPIVFQVATALKVNPHPLMLAVALGASIAFLTPFSHKAHLLVMHPGGYKSADYWKIGLLMTVLTFAVLALLVPIFMPFYS